MFSRKTVMIIAELNYSFHTDQLFMLGHNAVGWHSEHWHWLLVGILCGGEAALCKDLFSQFTILFAQYCNHTPFSTTLDTQKQTTKHLLLTKLHTADTSKILTTTQRPFFFTKGNVCGLNRSAAGGREGGFGINFAAEGGGWAGQRLLRDLDLSQSQASPCQHVCTGVHALSMLHANMMLFNYSTSCTAMLWSILVYYYKPE